MHLIASHAKLLWSAAFKAADIHMTTLTRPKLSEQQLSDFENNGFLLARQAFSEADMAHIRRWCDELVAMPEVSGRQWIYWEKSLLNPNDKIICRIENITPFHEGFREMTEALKAPMSQLLGEEAVLFKEKVNFKYPGGDGFKPHQDAQAGWDAYADFFISVLVCIDEATLENGCLKVVPGHHKRGLFQSWQPLSDAEMEGMQFVDCPTKPGDMIFFDCYAPHASEPNLTQSIRRLYYATYNRASAGDFLSQYYADKHKNYPPDVDRDPSRNYVFRV